MNSSCNNYYPITSSPQLGAGQLSTIDGPLSNDTIQYFYDELGRATNRPINGVAQTVALDALGRPMIVTNILGAFTNIYIGATHHLATNLYPNGQLAAFSYFPTNGDLRLQTIWNQSPSGSTISKFDYTYDAEGQIQTWTQQADANNPSVWSAEYDRSDQLLGVGVHTNTSTGAVTEQFVYGYDSAGNRTSETIEIGTNAPAIATAAFNALNQLTNLSSGGPVRFKGHLSETGTVSVAGNPATISINTNFTAFVQLSSGTSTNSIVATDLSSNTTSNRYRLTVTNNGIAQTLTYDLNGNLISAASAIFTNSYDWDAENRLVRITQATTNSPFLLTSELTYNGAGQRVRIVEKTNGVIQTDKRFVWCGSSPCEERDTNGITVNRRFLYGGEQITGTNYLFTADHLGSIRELTDSSATVRARYDYDPYGRRTKLTGSSDADFGFTGHYFHPTSGLHLAMFRAYDANVARWLSRDPIGTSGDRNLYSYGLGNPVNLIDPLGLCDQRAGDLLDWLSDHAAESYQAGGALKIEGFAANAVQTFIGTILGGDLVKEFATKSGAASGCGHNGMAAIYGIGALSAIALGSVTFGTGSAANEATHLVYVGIEKESGLVRYVGMTGRDLETRVAEHVAAQAGKQDLNFFAVEGAENLTKEEARVIEQKLINEYGLGKNGGQLLNERNSIAQKYWGRYGIIP